MTSLLVQGADAEGNEGSPLIILEELREYNQLIESKGLSVKLYLNEFNHEKFDKLTKLMRSIPGDNLPFSIELDSKEFKDSFEEQLPLLRKPKSANLCDTAGTEFFFNQWGGVRKHDTGRELHGRTYDNMPFIGSRQFAMPLVQIALP